MAKLSQKNEQVMKVLIEKGYFSKKSEIINTALFEYFSDKGLYEAVNKIELKEAKK